jgi:hypothetical protein
MDGKTGRVIDVQQTSFMANRLQANLCFDLGERSAHSTIRRKSPGGEGAAGPDE